MPKLEELGKTIDEKIKELRSQEFLKKSEERAKKKNSNEDPIADLIFSLGEAVYEAEKDNTECPYYSFIKEIKDKKELEIQKANEKTKEQTRTCPVCGATLSNTALFCVNCGSKIEAITSEEKLCPNCGVQIKETDKFCGSCGTKVQ